MTGTYIGDELMDEVLTVFTTRFTAYVSLIINCAWWHTCQVYIFFSTCFPFQAQSKSSTEIMPNQCIPAYTLIFTATKNV